MKPQSSVTKNKQAAAISSTDPNRPIGISAVSRIPPWGYQLKSLLVSMRPGEITFTRIFLGANSEANPRARPIIPNQRKGRRLLFRGDAAFGKPEVYEYLEQEMIGYAIRLSANAVLQREIAHLLVRPADWSSRRPIVSYYDFTYQAQSWSISRRVVAKVEWHQGELFPRVGFIVTNLSYPPKGIVRFYNGRGTAEQWIKEGKYTLNWTRLSCHKFVANQARLWLFVLAYNLGNFMRVGLFLSTPRQVRGFAGGYEVLDSDQSSD